MSGLVCQGVGVQGSRSRASLCAECNNLVGVVWIVAMQLVQGSVERCGRCVTRLHLSAAGCCSSTLLLIIQLVRLHLLLLLLRLPHIATTAAWPAAAAAGSFVALEGSIHGRHLGHQLSGVLYCRLRRDLARTSTTDSLLWLVSS